MAVELKKLSNAALPSMKSMAAGSTRAVLDADVGEIPTALRLAPVSVERLASVACHPPAVRIGRPASGDSLLVSL